MISLSSIFPTSAFIQGVGIGFSIAIPVGPIGMLCLRRSLNDGRRVGLVSGLGAATADAIYGLIAALGISAVQGFLLDHRFALQLGGGIFLVFLGLRTVWTKPTSDATTAAPRPRNLPAAFGSTLVLTLANPTTILAFAGIFAGLGVGITVGDRFAAFRMVTGVFLGSAVWWLLLSLGAGALRSRLQQGGLRILNIGSGLAIAGIGVWQLVQLR
jgi:threonine/homoserine/homoserine lactone efflux protein